MLHKFADSSTIDALLQRREPYLKDIIFRPYGADSHDFVGKDVALALGYDQTDKAI